MIVILILLVYVLKQNKTNKETVRWDSLSTPPYARGAAHHPRAPPRAL